jgi:hypothetical protein
MRPWLQHHDDLFTWSAKSQTKHAIKLCASSDSPRTSFLPSSSPPLAPAVLPNVPRGGAAPPQLVLQQQQSPASSSISSSNDSSATVSDCQ